MDALSDLLRVVRLDGAFFFAVEAADPWSVETVAARDLQPRILPHAEHLISYHIITEGRCYGNLLDGDAVELVPGDVLVFPHGDAHLISSVRGKKVNPNSHTTQLVRFPNSARVGPTGPTTTSIICGFLGCDRGPFNPLLASLPRMMHLRGMSKGWIGGFTQQLINESREQRSGSESVLTRLAEVMFIEVLRRYVDELPPGQTGWLAGLQDEVVGRVLMLLHSRPAHHWTLPDLAHEVASSRSALAERFSSIIGQPPMQYLTQWRMQVAANLLAQSSTKVSAIGAQVGYESEAAFSRAFKKATGLAPGAWRGAKRPVADG
ncbi:MAG TPA: AraC family transcriptional regulator [Gemmatimonadaceae bacterium]|jgi:AraC-like DNA-binding protein|nr:AraC family transcriptional regulator [Gemmatimonadaceae bacterium]